MNYIKRHAEISECGKFRYTLMRMWQSKNSGLCVFIGLNPSIADGDIDDPTIKKCVRFSERWGCNELVMLNCYAYRATDPKLLKKAGYPIGEKNDSFLYHMTVGVPKNRIICAWGTKVQPERATEVIRIIGGGSALELNKDLTPKHPLYVGEWEDWNKPRQPFPYGKGKMIA